ncbi:hypothetical protein IAU60_003722 [Kwoniella sp. DSM 27419]
MSPVPPPAGTYIPSDDWSDDPSFDISPTSHAFTLAPSPSSSTSSSSRHLSHPTSPTQNFRPGHTSSPLRNSITNLGNGKGTLKLTKREVERLDRDLDEMDFDDLPDSLPDLDVSTKKSSTRRPRSSTASSSSSLINRTVVGTGPSGIGTVTRMGSASRPPAGQDTMQPRTLALTKPWEVDLDALDEPDVKARSTGAKPTASGMLHFAPPKKGCMPPPDALDDLGFDLDEEDEDQATLKAGATLKAMLPPPRKLQTVPGPATPSHSRPPTTPPTQDTDEADFALPLNLTNLTLAAQTREPRREHRPRHSNASTATTGGWDSPTTSTSGGTKAGQWAWGSEGSPSSKRRSETSATSISDALPDTPVDGKVKALAEVVLNDDEDMEMGLELPSPTFFSHSRSKELNSILDRKRKPQFAPTTPLHSRTGTDESRRTLDDSFEDGLMLDEPGVELSRHRLREKKRARDQFAPGTLRKGLSLGTAAKSVAKEREKAWEKQREQGWGRHTPVPPPASGNSSNTTVRERTPSGLGMSLRSNSASAMAILHETPQKNRSDSPALSGRERESMRSRSGQVRSMLPPPVPSYAPTPGASSILPPTPSSSSRLRHQKSHHHLQAAPTASPSLARKQSLASLQDAMASGHAMDRTVDPLAGHHQQSSGSSSRQYNGAFSRLTMPTSSSKAKARPAVTSIFPKNDLPTPSSSASSMSSIGANNPVTPKYRGHIATTSRPMDVHRRTPKTWGDGTELDSIDDLAVGEEVGGKSNPHAGLGLGKPGRRGHETPARSSGGKTVELTERKKSGPKVGIAPTIPSATTASKRNKSRKPAGLIKHLGGADKKKVVGEMTWNPAALRWEGNESVLRDFDAPSAGSSRPALITHYTGSSVGVGGPTSPTAIAGGSSASVTPRIVGDMQFDPINMRWVSILSPEDDEPDPFEGMADDEDDERGGTITRLSGRKLVTIGGGGGGGGGRGGGFGGFSIAPSSTAWSSRLASESSITTSSGSVSLMSWPRDGHLDAVDESPSINSLVPDELWQECRSAEERHKQEMKGWIMRAPSGPAELKERQRKEEKRLWEIRVLAMKS